MRLKIKSNFLKNVFILTSSSVVAQLLLILVAPILTRLYTPEDFGVFAFYSALMSIITVVASLRYELAIPLPKSNLSALHLTLAAIVITIFTSLITFLAVFLFGNLLINSIGISSFYKNYFYLLPLSVLAVGIFKTLNFWAIRKGQYKKIAFAKLYQSILQIIIQISMGFLFKTPLGLILSDSVGKSSGTSILVRDLFRQEKGLLGKIDFKVLIQEIKKYWRFPVYSAPASFFNTSSLQLPQLCLIYIFDPVIAGWYTLVQRVIGMPANIIVQSVSQVYIGQISKYDNKNVEKLKFAYLNTTKKLFMISILPTILIAFFGPALFTLAFGSEWRMAGEFSRFLTIMIMFQFVISPVSQTLNVIEKQKLQFIWDLCRFIFLCIGFLVSNLYSLDSITTLMIFAGIMIIFYVILYILTFFEILKFGSRK